MATKRIKSTEQAKGRASLTPDSPPLSKRKRRCDCRRPTHSDLARIESLTAVGMPKDVVAAECDVSVSVLERWVREYSDIAAALRKGRKRRRMRAYSCLYEQAFPVKIEVDENGKTRTRPTGKGDPNLIKFWFKTQERISERAIDEELVLKTQKKHREGEADDQVSAPTIVYNLKPVAAADPHEEEQSDES